MPVLLIDESQNDQAVLGALRRRGYDVTLIHSASEALNLIQARQFDCILADVSTAAETLPLAKIRQLMTTSAVALMTTVPVESLVEEAVAGGSIEFRSLADIITNLETFSQPALLVAPGFYSASISAIRDKGLMVSSASTLQFMMNLLVDGWCQVICLNADIAGRTSAVKAAIVHAVSAKQLAILASGLDSTGITQTSKPHSADEFIALIERVSVNRAVPCGLTENFRGRLRSSLKRKVL